MKSNSTKNERRLEARERARLERAAAKRRERRNRIFLQSGIATGILAVLAIVAFVVVSGIKPPGPGPANMASDGITVGKGGVAVRTGAIEADSTPTPKPSAGSDTTADIRIYSDFLCPACNQFETQNKAYLDGLVKSGGATIDFHPIAVLDRFSLGSKYSTRATNAAACVADASPDSYYAVNSALFAAQPKEGTSGLTDQQLIDVVSKVEGLAHETEIADCIRNTTFASWVDAASQRALTGPIEGTDAAKIEVTPTVFVNGKRFDSAKQSFKDFVASVVGDTGAEK